MFLSAIRFYMEPRILIAFSILAVLTIHAQVTIQFLSLLQSVFSFNKFPADHWKSDGVTPVSGEKTKKIHGRKKERKIVHAGEEVEKTPAVDSKEEHFGR